MTARPRTTTGRQRSGVGSWEECRDYCDNECTNCAGFSYNSDQSECFMNHGSTGSGAPFQAGLDEGIPPLSPPNSGSYREYLCKKPLRRRMADNPRIRTQATHPGSGWQHFFNGRLCRERPYYHLATTARLTFQGPFSICTGEPMLAGAPVPSAELPLRIRCRRSTGADVRPRRIAANDHITGPDSGGGGHGGFCTCPDGRTYGVGDSEVNCGALACNGGTSGTVRARPGRLSALSVFLCKSVLYGVFVWARRALNSRKWHFPARAGQPHGLGGVPGLGPGRPGAVERP